VFVKERKLNDSVVVVNEVMDEIRRKNHMKIIVKVNFEKAHDYVNCII